VKTTKEIWLTLAREVYPQLNEDQLGALSLEAASKWYMGEESELTKLFDQYVMIKTLKGL
jgi:hypothetical protein